MKRILFGLLAVLLLVPLAALRAADLRARALAETAVPVRPGVPGGQPFWNGRSVQFLYLGQTTFWPEVVQLRTRSHPRDERSGQRYRSR